MDRLKLSKKAERLVSSLLPESKWINAKKESRQKHDIEWRGLKIDAKGTEAMISNGCLFHVGSFKGKDMLFVGVAFMDEGEYFFVWGPTYATNKYVNKRNAIAREDLPQSLLKIAAKHGLA